MRLKTVYPGAWRILAPVDVNGSCELIEQIEALASDPRTESTAAKFVAIWDRIPPQGPHELPDGMHHRIDEKHEIYEFRARNHRILCFRAGGGRIVICSHLMLKTRSDIPKREKNRAISLRKLFLDAERNGKILIID